MIGKTLYFDIKSNENRNIKVGVEQKSVGKIKNKYGDFWLYFFCVDDIWTDYYVLIKAKVDENYLPIFSSTKLFLRIDSGCITGNIFLDISCDCKNQLDFAMSELQKNDEGIIIYIPNQDGRGLGIINKLQTLTLIYEENLDTISAFEKITNSKINDKRTYEGCIGILKYFRVPLNRQIHLISGSTNKSIALNSNGYENIITMEKQFEINEYIIRNSLAKRNIRQK